MTAPTPMLETAVPLCVEERNLRATINEAVEADLTVALTQPEEGGHCETLGKTTCITCYVD